MYDLNLSPDKQEVMFTEEAAMSYLIREGLMALWSSRSEGKFVANDSHVEAASDSIVGSSIVQLPKAAAMFASE